MRIYENGVGMADCGPYTTSDVLTIAYEGSTVRYLKNGQVVRTVSTTAGRTFYFDSSFYNTGFTFNAIQFGGSVLATVTTGGGAAIKGNTVSKGSGTDGAWDSDAYSQTSYTGNAYVSAKAAQTDKSGMFGLNADPTANRSYNSLDYAWYTRSDGVLAIYESGTAVGTFGSYTTSDVLAIVYEGNTVSYLKNGLAMRTVTTTAGRSFYFDSSFYHTGCTFNAIQFGTTASQSTRLDWVIQNVSTVYSRVHKEQKTNAFGEVVQEIDGLGRVTDLAYNTLGRLVKKQDPETSITLANGFPIRARPTSRFVYDLSGRLIATVDPNGNTNTQVWLNGGEHDEIVLERHADGGVVRHAYDVFGNKRVDVDALGYRTDTAYDKLDHVVEVRHPQRANGSQAIDRYGYDAAGNRITHTNALGEVETTDYDSLGRVTKTRSYAGFTVTYAYTYSAFIRGAGDLQVGGWQKTTRDAVGRTLVDQQDVFGRTSWHKDQGNHEFTYTYNGAGWLISQSGTSGQAIITDYYANGYVKSIWDRATGTYTRYEYDDAGNRIFEGYVTLKDRNDPDAGARDYYQYAQLEYDELNRLKRVFDLKAEINYEYDAASNRRRMVSTYHDGGNGAMRVQDYWYVYDAMNRFTVTMGTLSTGARGASATDTSVTIVKGSTGVDLAYNLGSQRVRAANGADDTVEQYRYSADGYLEDVTIGGVLRSRRAADLLGRVTTYTEWNAAGGQVYTRSTTYDQDSRVLAESSVDNSGTHTVTSSTTNLYYKDANADNTDNAGTASSDGAGQLARSTTTSRSNGDTTVVDSYYAYEYWDSAQQMAVTAAAWDSRLKGNNKYWRPGYAYHIYDANGHLAQAIDAGLDGAIGDVGTNAAADDRSFRYTSDAQGLILVRDEVAAGQANRIQRYYYANNVRVGDVGNDGPSRTDYAQAISARGVDHKDYRHWQPVAAADFDQNYEPVGPHYPGMTPSSYTVRAGDTLQSIARAAWGDGAMWYLIADANGLTGTEALTAGQVLTLPNKVTNIHNNAGTFRPYNPGEAIGDTSPTIPTPPAPPKPENGGCGGASIIVAIVAVVATVFTAGAMAPYCVNGLAGLWSVGLSTLASNVGIALVAGAVGSVAGQLTGMALGVQDSFSWGAVAAGGLASAAMAWMGPVANTNSEVANLAINAAARNVVGQGINLLAGQQKGFSWGSVAASAIAAPIANAVSESVVGKFDGSSYRNGSASSWANGHRMAASLVDAGVRSLTAAATRITLVGGHLAWEAVAADTLSSFLLSSSRWQTPKALGNATGNSVIGATAGTGTPQGLGQPGDTSGDIATAAAAQTEAHMERHPEADRRIVYDYYLEKAAAANQASFISGSPNSEVAKSYPVVNWNDGIEFRKLPPLVTTNSGQAPFAEGGASMNAYWSQPSQLASQLAGGTVGVVKTFFRAADGLVRIGGNAVLQVGDILTFGYNHDSPIIQQAWLEQGALASGVVRLATEPRAVVADAMSRIDANYTEAARLHAQGRDFEAAIINSEQTSEIAAGVLGGVQAVRSAASFGAGALRSAGVPDWNIRMAAPNGTLYSNPIPFDLEPFVKNGGPLFENQLPNQLKVELAEARTAGVKPIAFGDSAFEATVNQGTVKFVVTETGDLRIAPHTASNGTEISHAVLSNGRPVLAAGEADIAGFEGQYVGVDLRPHSGHFMNGATEAQNAAVRQIAKTAFGRYSIVFPD